MNTLRKEEMNNDKKDNSDRIHLIRSITKKACQENDEALRKLSKT